MTAERRGTPARQVEGQGELLDVPVGAYPPGPAEQAVRDSVEAAALDRVDKAAATLAVELGRAVDIGNRRRDPYAVAAAARELREQLIRLQLDPVARGAGDNAGDAFDLWLKDNAGAS